MNIEKLNQQYMRMAAEEGFESGEYLYAAKILQKKNVEGLLRLKKRNLDGQVFYYYSIDGTHTMVEAWDGQNIDERKLEQFLKDLAETIKTLDSYLLKQEQLYLNPSYIMYDVVERKWKFIYVTQPYHSQSEDMIELLTFFVSKLGETDHDQSRIYEYLSDCMRFEEDISPAEMVRLWMEGMSERENLHCITNEGPETLEEMESTDESEGTMLETGGEWDGLETKEMPEEACTWKEKWNRKVYEKLYLVPYSPH